MSLQHMGYLILLLTLLSGTPLFPNQAQAADIDNQPQLAGRIVSVDCATPDGFVVDRGRNHPQKASVFDRDSRLFDGDYVRITDPNCRVTVSVGSTVRALSPSNSPYLVAVPKAPSPIERLRYAMEYGEKDFGIGVGLGVGRAGEENAEITIPLLELWDNQIAAGTRTLHLAWRKGEGPFEVTVAMKGKGKAPLARTGNTQSRATRFENLTLQPGTYIVTVQGKDGHSAQATFDAVNPSQIPTPPSELQTGHSDGSFLQAGWLASNGHGEYVFEAYQRISALGNKEKQISRVQEWLESGWRPRLE